MKDDIWIEMKDYHKNYITVKDADYDCETVWIHCYNPDEPDPGIILTRSQAKRLIKGLQKFVDWAYLPEEEKYK